MPHKTFDAVIVHTGDDCTLHFPNDKYVYAEIKRLFKDQAKVTVEVKSRRVKRTLEQNAYFHMGVGLIADETGNDPAVVKNTIKALYAKKPLLDVDGQEIVDQKTGEVAYYIQDTSDMNTEEMAALTQKMIEFAQDFLNLRIPLPDENIPLNFKNK